MKVAIIQQRSREEKVPAVLASSSNLRQLRKQNLQLLDGLVAHLFHQLLLVVDATLDLVVDLLGPTVAELVGEVNRKGDRALTFDFWHARLNLGERRLERYFGRVHLDGLQERV